MTGDTDHRPDWSTSHGAVADVLVADLHDLAGDLGGDRFTASSASMLHRDLRLAVRSFLGFTLTFTVKGPAVPVALHVVLTALDPEQIGDTISVPLPVQPDGFAASLTVYAEQPGALAELSEELAAALDLPAQALTVPFAPGEPILPGICGLDAFAQAHQAVGVLLNAGHNPDSAAVELLRRGLATAGGITTAAQELIEHYAND